MFKTFKAFRNQYDSRRSITAYTKLYLSEELIPSFFFFLFDSFLDIVVHDTRRIASTIAYI